MFSRRLAWDEPPNPLSALLDHKRRAGEPILDLTLSNPTRAGLTPPPGLLEALTHPAALSYEPSPRGLATAREAVAAYYRRRGYTVDPARVWLCASTSEAYGMLFKLLADPGDAILVPRPSYPLFGFLAQLEAVRVETYPLCYHGEWMIDPYGLRQAPPARALVVVNPNNPTGSCLRRHERELLRERGVPVLSDEVFGDYLDALAPHSLPSLVEETELPGFVMSGFSKILGLPQMKLGWIIPVGPPRFVEEAESKLELLLDTYLPVSAPVQHAAPAWLAAQDTLTRPIQARVAQNRQALRALAQDSPCSPLAADGGWTALLRIPAWQSEEEWSLGLLRDLGLYVHPGYFFDFDHEAYLALSLLLPPDAFAHGLAQLLAYASRPPS